jgi:hypothetical protein
LFCHNNSLTAAMVFTGLHRQFAWKAVVNHHQETYSILNNIA